MGDIEYSSAEGCKLVVLEIWGLVVCRIGLDDKILPAGRQITGFHPVFYEGQALECDVGEVLRRVEHQHEKPRTSVDEAEDILERCEDLIW